VFFTKLEATGNDFVAIDNRYGKYDIKDAKLWQKVCDRRLGVGADGVLLLGRSDTAHFSMGYLNADGSIGEMCGNGGRAIASFAKMLGILPTNNRYTFTTLNGLYSAEIDNDLVKIKMTELYDYDAINLKELNISTSSCYLNTGVPHIVFEIPSVDSFDLKYQGPLLAHHKLFEKGTNVNVFELVGRDRIKSRTFERGVEDETLSCGTGATAMAIYFSKRYKISDRVFVNTRGGELVISFNADYTDIYLSGKVNCVFKGEC